MSFEFIFFDHPSGAPIHDAWLQSIADLLPPENHSQIRVIALPFEEMRGSAAEFDCLVSPGNSYGIMDGGIDMVFSRAFSGGGDDLALSRVVQDAIVNRYFGFAPPTSCTLVNIPEKLRNVQYPRCKVLVTCPTMRVPMSVRWHEDLVYNTMWTLLAELEHWNASHMDEDKIRTVAVPGLGTGIGMYDKRKCARQMVLAIKHFRDARSKEGRARLADRSWTTNWDNVIESAVEVNSD